MLTAGQAGKNEFQVRPGQIAPDEQRLGIRNGAVVRLQGFGARTVVVDVQATRPHASRYQNVVSAPVEWPVISSICRPPRSCTLNRIYDVRYEWNGAKNRPNQKNHGRIALELATLVFKD
jgi:hypothetical protein